MQMFIRNIALLYKVVLLVAMDISYTNGCHYKFFFAGFNCISIVFIYVM